MSYQSESNWQTQGKRSATQAAPWGGQSDNNRMRDEREAPNSQNARNGSPQDNKKMRKRDQKEVDLNFSSETGYPLPPDGEFSSYPEIHPKTVEKLIAGGIPNLFPIQQHSFHPIYNREDVIGRDLTGCGKTLAFALPVIEKLRHDKTLGSRKIQAIVLAPTRELAIQCEKTVSTLKHHPQEFESMTVYGGVPIDVQERKLRTGTDIFVGTTGRVLDHMERGNIDFSAMQTVILDEADQMLNMGFKEDIEKILKKIKSQSPNQIQICLFSATVPAWVRDVANQHMRSDLKMVDLCKDLTNKTAKNVKHLAIEVPYHTRINTLADVLQCYGSSGKTIVFTSTKRDADELSRNPQIQSIEAMHGDISQHCREATLGRFRNNQLKVLVATDVASRGLDIPNVDLVVQIEPPNNTESYIHRSGRTARAGASGTCITFYNNKNEHMIDQIAEQSGVNMERISKPRPQDAPRPPPQQQSMQQPHQPQTIDIDSRPDCYAQKPTQAPQNNSNNVFDTLSLLENVRSDKLPQFEMQARKLIERHRGDAIAALCRSLAYIAENNGGNARSANTSAYNSKGHDNQGGNNSGGGGSWGGNNGGRGSQGRGGPPGGYGGGGNGYGGGNASGGQGRGSRPAGGYSGGGNGSANGGGNASWGNRDSTSWGTCSNLPKEHLLPNYKNSSVSGRKDAQENSKNSQPFTKFAHQKQPETLLVYSDSDSASSNYDSEGEQVYTQQSKFTKDPQPTTSAMIDPPSSALNPVENCLDKASTLTPQMSHTHQHHNSTILNDQPTPVAQQSSSFLQNELQTETYHEESKKQQFDDSTVFVSNLSSDTDENSLMNLFESVQLKVDRAKLINSSATAREELNNRPCQSQMSSGFVRFSNFEDAQLAVERCNGLMINGHPQRLIVAMAGH